MKQTIDLAIDAAHQQGATQIYSLKMRIGAMSGVVREALEFAFDVVTQGTIAEGAKLEVETTPVVCYCPNCNLKFQPPDLFYRCPQCSQVSTQICSGREIELASLEVD